MIGYNDINTNSGVYFHSQKESAFSTVGEVIPYDLELSNVGRAMNISTGVFTVPTVGRYFFSFNAYAGDASGIALRIYGGIVAQTVTGTAGCQYQ